MTLWLLQASHDVNKDAGRQGPSPPGSVPGNTLLGKHNVVDGGNLCSPLGRSGQLHFAEAEASAAPVDDAGLIGLHITAACRSHGHVPKSCQAVSEGSPAVEGTAAAAVMAADVTQLQSPVLHSWIDLTEHCSGQKVSWPVG